jgi:tetratricopeptide (TPR) repeat protein
MTLAAELFDSHKYADALALGRQMLSVNPDDIGAIRLMADALVALERYDEAIPLYERVDAYEKRRSHVTPGHPGRQMNISCLYWFLGNRPKAIALMRGLVDGILNGSIQYSTDVAGGMTQGLLLYYMGTTANQPDQTTFALNYMRNRLKRRFASDSWPSPVARYYLGEISFSEVLAAATEQSQLQPAIDVARVNLLNRRHLCGALFHDGIKSRVEGAEGQCLARMRQCYALENPRIEHEWYLARYEVEQAALES